MQLFQRLSFNPNFYPIFVIYSIGMFFFPRRMLCAGRQSTSTPRTIWMAKSVFRLVLLPPFVFFCSAPQLAIIDKGKDEDLWKQDWLSMNPAPAVKQSAAECPLALWPCGVATIGCIPAWSEVWRMMYYNQLETGRRIQKLRRERYLTQEELAIKLNISDRHLRNLERG